MQETAKLQFVIDAQNKASAAFKQAEAQVASLSSKFRQSTTNMEEAVKASKIFAVGLAGVGAAVGAFGYKAISAAADMEQTRIAFETMLGSGEKAGAFITELVNFAKTTPFELKGLEQSAKQLLAYGFAQEEVIPNLKSLGDIAAGVGMDKLPNLILAFGQVKAATRLTGMELRQFTEAGVPLLDELAKQLGVTAGDIQTMVSAGEIGFDEVKKALESMTGEGGRFNNLMEKQAKSLSGMISNLKDAWDIFLRGEGARVLEWAKAFVAIAIDIVQNKLPAFINKIEELSKWLGEHKVVLYMVAGAIAGALAPALWALVTVTIPAAIVAFAGLALAMAPFLIGGAAIGGVVYGLVWLFENSDRVVTGLKDMWQGFLDFWSDFWESIKDRVRTVADWIMAKIQPIIDIWEKIKGIGSAVGKGFSSVFGGGNESEQFVATQRAASTRTAVTASPLSQYTFNFQGDILDKNQFITNLKGVLNRDSTLKLAGQ